MGRVKSIEFLVGVLLLHSGLKELLLPKVFYPLTCIPLKEYQEEAVNAGRHREYRTIPLVA